MKKLLPFLLAALLLLTACGQKPVFGVSTNENNNISIIADRGPKDSMGLGYLTVGENEQIVVDATGLNRDGKLALRFMAGVLGSENFSDEPAIETVISGADLMTMTAEPGEYTVGVIAQNKVSGNALIYTEPVDEMSMLGYTPDSFIGTWVEKIAGRGNIEITKISDGQYRVQINWGSSADEMAVWMMTAVPAESNVLRYTDCYHSILTLREDDSGTETVEYENGTGELILLSTNELMWQDETGHAGDDALFISAG